MKNARLIAGCLSLLASLAAGCTLLHKDADPSDDPSQRTAYAVVSEEQVAAMLRQFEEMATQWREAAKDKVLRTGLATGTDPVGQPK